MNPHPLIAIIPAAGLSRRMGQPKLLLPWRGSTVIAHLVGELRAAGVTQIFVVLRTGDEALLAAVVAAQAIPLQPPVDPPDMRSSVEYGLQKVVESWNFPSTDATASDSVTFPLGGWLLIPADHPIVSHTTIVALQQAWRSEERQILIPTYAGKRGH
ncbi:MAG: NTP transferase domain-containing protein, partial [Planctomycetota bacterium]